MAKKSGELTPLMKQYWDVKSLHQDKILFFRMGDFYELFYEDAVKAAPLLGLTLTQRNKKAEDQTPMCGFPHHSAAAYINKLLSHGIKIAVCDQVEDPSTSKGLVKREITRILTPGMVYDNESLEKTKAHYIASVGEKIACFVDCSTGEAFFYDELNKTDVKKLLELLPVVEVVVSNSSENESAEVFKNLSSAVVLSRYGEDQLNAQERLIGYIKSLSNSDLFKVFKPFEKRELNGRMMISPTTLKHLEIFSSYKGDVSGSLFESINKTKTSSGARLLRNWICFPLRNKKQIEGRQDQIQVFRDHMLELKKTREALAGMGDVERRLSKIAQPQACGRDLLALADAILAGASALKWSKGFFQTQAYKQVAYDQIVNNCYELSSQLKNVISIDAPVSVKQGNIINKNISPDLDKLIELTTNAHSLLERLEQKEKELTGISSLKIRYNNVFGYYIEITNTHKDKVPAHYNRKQTLANAERYCTEELIELEKQVLSAQVKRNELEFSLFEEQKTCVLNLSATLLNFAEICSELDVVSSLAWLSLEHSYCRPIFSEDSSLSLVRSRHPVVERFTQGAFVANNIRLNESACMLLTGPNMAGKSTLMRQVALVALLAQMGSYVPADEAKLPLYDAIYTRIGASDQLSEGLSTFMVEMTETAQMLKLAKKESLLILDEVGRGTSTFDGMCLAQSVLEYILTNIGSQVLFATHYHELTSIDRQFSQVTNAHMMVSDDSKGGIQFLHILSEGAAGKSYGVKVAELAGLPDSIIQRAQNLLVQLESEPSSKNINSIQVTHAKEIKTSVPQMSFFDKEIEHNKNSLIEELKKFSVQKSSPLQALNKIAEWQDKLN